jgi:hypothetical protein
MMIVTLAQRLVILACLRRIMTLSHWRSSEIDMMIELMLHQPYHIL